MKQELLSIAQTLIKRIEKSKSYGKTLTIKVKFSDFKQITRSKTNKYEIDDFDLLWELCLEIFDAIEFSGRKVRLLGVSVSNLQPDNTSGLPIQLTFDF